MELEAARELLLDHARHPRWEGLVSHATHAGVCQNPLCGDLVAVSLRLNTNSPTHSFIEEIRIRVSGCTIATASASLMAEWIQNKNLSLISTWIKTVPEYLKGQSQGSEDLAPLQALEHLRINPTRLPCALLAWQALEQALFRNKTRNPP